MKADGYLDLRERSFNWRRALWVLLTLFCVAEQLSSSLSVEGARRSVNGRQPVSGRPWTTMCFAPLSSSDCNLWNFFTVAG